MARGTRCGAGRAVCGLAVAVVMCGACGGTPQGPGTKVPAPRQLWGPYAEPSLATNEAVPGPVYKGRLFAMRVTPPDLAGAKWIACDLTVPYRYEPRPSKTVTVQLERAQDVAQFFSVGGEALRDAMAGQGPARIAYTVAGRFVLDTPPPRAAGIVCPAGSHHVQTIVVGAYRLVLGGEPVGGGSAPGVREAGLVITRGRPDTCAEARGPAPVEGCRVPLAFALRETPGHAEGEAVRVGAAGTGSRPSEATMPR